MSTTTKTGLMGTHCEACNRNFYPARQLCPTCWADNLPDHRLPATGTVATWTVVRLGRKFPTPYALAYVDFESNVRVLGRVANWEDGITLKKGATATVHPVDEEVDGRVRSVELTFTVDKSNLEA